MPHRDDHQQITPVTHRHEVHMKHLHQADNPYRSSVATRCELGGLGVRAAALLFNAHDFIAEDI